MEYYVFAILCDNERSFTFQRSEVHTYIFCARSYDSKVVVFTTNDDELNVTNTLCNLNDHPK